MPENSSNHEVKVIETILAEEYKTAFKEKQYLDGFGEFTIFSEIADIKEEQDPKVHSDRYDPYFGDFYFASLGSAEANMLEFCRNNTADTKSIRFFSLRGYVNDVVHRQLSDLTKASSSLCGEPRFVEAWFDEMMRASIRGLRKAGCEIRGLPLQYSEPASAGPDISPAIGNLEQKVDSVGKKIDYSVKHSSRSHKYTLIGLAGLYLIAAAAGIASFVFIHNAKKQLGDKEAEWKSEMNYKINSAYNNVLVNAEVVFRQRIDAYLNSCAPDVGKGLSLEERLPLVFNMLKADAKKELVQTVAAEGMPLFEARYGQPISEEKIVQNIIDAIKSGRITISDLIQPPAGRPEKKE